LVALKKLCLVVNMIKKISFFLSCSILGLTLFAQPAVTFSTQQLNVSPSAITGDVCIQIGLFATADSAGDWAQIFSTVNYSLVGGIVLAGDPTAKLTPLTGTLTGITNPGTDQSGGACVGPIFNAATLGGSAANFLSGTDDFGLSDDAIVDTGNQKVTLSGLASDNVFTLQPGVPYLYAILTFPVDSTTTTGRINIDFEPNTGSDENILNNVSFEIVEASLVNGNITIFDTIDCGDAANYAVFTDNIGGGSVSTQNNPSPSPLGIDYVDPAFGGNGGDIDIDLTFSNTVVGYQVTHNHGYDSGYVNVAIEPTDNINLTLDGGFPSYTFEITYFVMGLDMEPAPGSVCTVELNWNPTTCNLSWLNQGINTGNNSVLTMVAENVFVSLGIVGTLDVPNGATGLTDPTDIATSMFDSTAGNAVTFTLIDQVIPAGDWAGTYEATIYAPDEEPNPNKTTSTCQTQLGFTCPTNNTVGHTPSPVDIGDDVTVTFSGLDTLDWDVTYNGTNTNVPGDTANLLVGPVVASDTTISVTANGFGPSGQPCTDLSIIDIDYALASCTEITASTEGGPTEIVFGPYDIGVVVTIEVLTTNTVSATLAGAPMTPAVGVPGVDYNVTWTADHTVTGPASLQVVLTNADGETSNCEIIEIEVNCIETNIVDIASVGQSGITIQSSIGAAAAGLEYEIYYSDTCGQLLYDPIMGYNYVGTVTLDANGVATLNAVVMPDVCYYVVCGNGGAPGDGGVIANNPYGNLRTVPTLETWGLIAFIMSLVVAGIVLNRKA
jgi:hypothetical protein